MQEDKITMQGFHGTCSKHFKSIKEYGLDPKKVKYREDHWLGQGVYFFDDLEIAEWWAIDQSEKSYNINTYPIVYSAQIIADKHRILNLDNKIELDSFLDFIVQTSDDIKVAYTEKVPEFTEESFRAVYFDYYKRQNDIAVIIYTFSKPLVKYAKMRNHNETKLIKKFSNILKIDYHEKQICVSDKICIEDIKIEYNGKEEVI